jgi:ABC-type branched-subunit amino acid transport system substrate-binding protein
LIARKLPPPLVIPIVAGRRDYGPDLAKLNAARPEAAFFAGYPPEAAVVLRGLRTAGFTGTLIASDANATDGFAAAAAAPDLPSPKVNVMVMVPAAGSGGLGERNLERAAEDAMRTWLDARTSGDPVQALARSSEFDERGDARVPSFRAAPLVDGRWSDHASRLP